MNRAEILELAQPLLAKYGLSEWKVGFIDFPNKAGECDYGVKTIRISIPVAAVRTPHETRMTVLHEIAHALVGHHHGHDAMWAQVCKNIGGTGEECYSVTKESRSKILNFAGETCRTCFTILPRTGVCDNCE